jgi:hypothetical protein
MPTLAHALLEALRRQRSRLAPPTSTRPIGRRLLKHAFAVSAQGLGNRPPTTGDPSAAEFRPARPRRLLIRQL